MITDPYASMLSMHLSNVQCFTSPECSTRTLCYWFGIRETRWARTAYAGNLGREYLLPVRGVGTHGYKSEIEALCWMTWLLGCLMGCGVGTFLSICGNASVNFAAPYTCHTRSRMRYKYGLPPACPFLPLGIDDCLVHCFCFYCSSHQEMRELAVRGVDGPGLHTMDLARRAGDASAERAAENPLRPNDGAGHPRNRSLPGKGVVSCLLKDYMMSG